MTKEPLLIDCDSVIHFRCRIMTEEHFDITVCEKDYIDKVLHRVSLQQDKNFYDLDSIHVLQNSGVWKCIPCFYTVKQCLRAWPDMVFDGSELVITAMVQDKTHCKKI